MADLSKEDITIALKGITIEGGAANVNKLPLQAVSQAVPTIPGMEDMGAYFKKEINGLIYLHNGISSNEKFTPAMLLMCEETHKHIKERIKEENFNKDCELMKEMVLSAKHGDFDNVKTILKKTHYLINSIPEERTWSALHQAVWWDDISAVKMLLEWPNCDVNIRAKSNKDGITNPGDKPYTLSKSPEISLLLQQHADDDLGQGPTYATKELGDEYIHKGIPLFLFAPAFINRNIISSINFDHCKTLLDLTNKFIGVAKENFQDIKKDLAETLYPFSIELYDKCKGNSTSGELFKYIIKLYTDQHVYKNVNAALRRSSDSTDPTGDDFLLCLYIFMLEVVLLSWDKLGLYSGTTYRGMELGDSDMEKYTKGTEFYWMSFTSTSSDEHAAFKNNTKFVFDNSGNSKWRPRDIHKFSVFKDESEMLYPAGARFKVVTAAKVSGVTTIHLKLLD